MDTMLYVREVANFKENAAAYKCRCKVITWSKYRRLEHCQVHVVNK